MPARNKLAVTVSQIASENTNVAADFRDGHEKSPIAATPVAIAVRRGAVTGSLKRMNAKSAAGTRFKR